MIAKPPASCEFTAPTIQGIHVTGQTGQGKNEVSIDLWLFDVRQLPTANQPTEEQSQRAERFRSAVDRRDWLTGHAKVSEILQEYGANFTSLRDRLDASLSHCGPFWLLAVATCPSATTRIGVDLEGWERDMTEAEMQTLAADHFSLAEVSWLRKTGNLRERFWQAWTVREALIKSQKTNWNDERLHSVLAEIVTAEEIPLSTELELRSLAPLNAALQDMTERRFAQGSVCSGQLTIESARVWFSGICSE